MVAKLENKTQKERLGEAFKEVSKDVTSNDRKEASLHANTSLFTISRMLNGDVRNLDLGVKVLKFLKAKIEERESILK